MTEHGNNDGAVRSVSAFEYQRADCWEEAVELLGLWDGQAKIIAGGQSLVPMMNLRLTFPEALIDVDRIADTEPYLDGDELVLPAMTRHATAMRSPLVQEHWPLLAHALQFVGNVRVRNRGTIGGSMAHADPTGEIPCVALAAGAHMVVHGKAGARSIPAGEWFVTYLTTAMSPDEVLTEIRVPSESAGSGWGFHEVVRRFSDFATVSVAVQVRDRTTDGVGGLDVVLGGVSDRPVAVPQEVLAPLLTAPGDREAIAQVALDAATPLDPESDLHGSADYRRELVRVHTRRVLEVALGGSPNKPASAQRGARS